MVLRDNVSIRLGLRQVKLVRHGLGRPLSSEQEQANRQVAFSNGRARLLQFLWDLPADAWERTGQHSQWGPLSIASLATLVHRPSMMSGSVVVIIQTMNSPR